MEVNIHFALLIIIVPVTGAFTCDETDTTCTITLEITHYKTMTNNIGSVYPYNGALYLQNTNTSVPADEVIVGDGFVKSRLVTVANKKLPGPDIIAYEGQRLIIYVKNKLASDSVTIHWHGLPQRHSQWNDGTGFITQCPTLPGQTFTYNFTATPKGTYWYHSHVGFQRTEGLFGSLIIRKKGSTMPEHIMQVNTWNHDWNSIMDNLNIASDEFGGTIMPDGEYFVSLKIHSVLINGRSRYYDPVSKTYNSPPLTVFNVTSGTQYRFRIINTDGAFPIKVSFDNHRLLLVASDGYDLEPQPADAVITNPGERYDVIITANQTAGNYWVRAETLALKIITVGEAILHYDGAPIENPSSTTRKCTPSDRCVHLNCPFVIYPAERFTDCKGFDTLKSAADNDPAPIAAGTNFKEVFLNFGSNDFGSSINEKSFVFPTVSALTQPALVEQKCSNAGCSSRKSCRCAHTLDVNYNDTVQLVLLNFNYDDFNQAHPVHLHGYSYYVLKTGYGSQNTTTGFLTTPNQDIDCQNTTSNCFNATWRNSSWLGGNVPDIEIQNAPRKDTLLIPAGGYAVVRIRADNPGVWFMHCHIEFHALDGMAMMLNVSSPTPLQFPDGLPTCHGFHGSNFANPAQTDLFVTESTPAKTVPFDSKMCHTPSSSDKDQRLPDLYWITLSIMGFIILVMLMVNIALCKKLEAKRHYIEDTDEDVHTRLLDTHTNRSYAPNES